MAWDLGIRLGETVVASENLLSPCPEAVRTGPRSLTLARSRLEPRKRGFLKTVCDWVPTVACLSRSFFPLSSLDSLDDNIVRSARRPHPILAPFWVVKV